MFIRVMGILVIVGLCLGSASIACGARIIEFTKVERSPNLKGDLSDPIWQKAKVHGGFTTLGKNEKPGAETEVYPLYDDQNLYLGICCHEPYMDKISSKVTMHDGPVWGDDDIEIFVSSTGKTMYQFITNSIGTQYESLNELYESVISDMEWNSRWKVKTGKSADRWTAEVTIPFSILELKEDTPQEWVLNIGRERHTTGKTELTDIIPVKGFWSWQDIVTGIRTSKLEVDFKRFFYSVEEPWFSTRYIKEGIIENSIGCAITNSSGHESELEVIVSAYSGAEEILHCSKETTIGRDERKTVSIPTGEKIKDISSLSWHVEIKDLNRDYTCLSRIFNRIENKSLLNIFEKQPAYNSKFYTDQERKVILEIDANSRIKNLGLEFNIYQQDRIINASRDSTGKRQYVFDFSRYNYGSYVIETNLLGQNDEIVARDRREIEILKPSSGSEVTISKENYLLVDGRPFFPMGFFGAQVSLLEEMKADGFNTLFDYFRAPTLKGDGLTALKDKFDLAHKFGFKMMLDLQGQKKGQLAGDKLPEEAANDIVRAVNYFKDHPGLLAYYVHDEPEGHNILPKLLASFSRLVKNEDPYHPTLILGHTIGIKKYFVSDIYMPDAYIKCMEGELGDLRVVKTDIDIAMEVVRKRKGKGMVLVTLKALDYTTDGSGHRAPNFNEMRNSSYEAIMRGARGILYYTYWGHGGVRAFPECRESTRMIAREMKYLAPVILLGSPLSGLKSSNPDIKLFARKYKGNLFLIALNSCSRSIKAKITLPEDIKSLNLLSEDMEVRVKHSVFSDRFESYGVHIYTTDKNMPKLETIREVKKKIKTDFANKMRSGNFALAARGTRISSSTKIAWGGKLANLINGVNDDSQTIWDYIHKGKPQWIELDFGRKRKVGKVLIYNVAPLHRMASVTGYQIQVYRDGQWITIIDRKNNDKSIIEERIPPTVTNRMRLNITGQYKIPDRFCVAEIEVYSE